MWFADSAYDSIGRVTPAGAVALVTGGITPGSDPQAIAIGPDGNLWFTQPGVDRVRAETMTVNTASRAVMERCGLRFVRTFHLEWDEPIEGTEHGEVEYEITKAEWLRR